MSTLDPGKQSDKYIAIFMILGFAITWMNISAAINGELVPIDQLNAIGTFSPKNCSGTLIEDNLVLTAAHCLCNYKCEKDPCSCNTNNCLARAFFTLHNVKIKSESNNRQDYTFSGDVLVNPSACKDLAIIKLDQNVSDITDVEPLKINQISFNGKYIKNSALNVGDNLKVVGFGATGAKCTNEIYLKRFANVTVTHLDYARINNSSSSYEYNYKKSCCPGDSGGPAINDELHVVGVIKGGPDKIFQPYCVITPITSDIYNWIYNCSHFGQCAQGME